MPHFQAHECPPPSSSFPVGESLFSDTLRFQAHQPAPTSSSPPASKSSCFQAHQPAPPSSSPPASKSSHFQAHQPAPPSSSPPGSESSFVTCHISKLTKPLVNLFIAPSLLPPCGHGPSKICHRTILPTLLRPPLPTTW